MSDLIGIHCYISGTVQGVWFRASAKDEALQLNVTGWARNLPDGRVEVLAYGERDQLAKLYTWLQKGPRLAKVTQASYEELPWHEYSGFDVL